MLLFGLLGLASNILPGVIGSVIGRSLRRKVTGQTDVPVALSWRLWRWGGVEVRWQPARRAEGWGCWLICRHELPSRRVAASP